MRHSANRKRHLADSEKKDTPDFSLANTLQSVKRRRLSNEVSEDGFPQQSRDGTGDRENTNGGWQTVPSRSSKQKEKRGSRSSNQKNACPSINFSHKVTRPITIEQLRDLALYVLADGIGPDWVAVRQSKGISKVVVMMVPGLDQDLLERAKALLIDKQLPLRRKELYIGKDNEQVISNTTDSGNQAVHVNGDQSMRIEPPPSVAANPPSRKAVGGIENEDTTGGSPQDHWLFDNIIPVKAPGDSKYSKVHSPLQAMLMSPEVTNKTKPKHTNERQFQPIATPITAFVHTSDELREAEYPIHPACFTSASDAALESARRDNTEQSKEAGWIDSDVTVSEPVIHTASSGSPRDFVHQELDVYAIDCEMVLTTDQKSSLARISVVSWPNGKVVIDKYVKPDLPIENYFTQYSGITPQILENVTTRLVEIQQELLSILTPSTVLLGHSLESDLNALRMTHPFIVDTSMIYPHPRGLPLRSSLKFLANKYLKREIQIGGARGHDSIEDARAVLDLVKLKCEKGPKFGTPEANGEPIFKRLSRHNSKDGKPLTSAIVEYGSSPERGLGKYATHAVGCQDDVEITAGMIRAIKGDDDGKMIPASGVSFVWGRLRALEFARGWVTNNNANANTASHKPESEATVEGVRSQTPEPSHEEIDQTILTTLQHITEVHDALPRTSMLMVYSGISDVRPVLKLQAMQAQYRKEFKTKKWDELSVKWTDVEEQALRNAVEKARLGWGYVGIV